MVAPAEGEGGADQVTVLTPYRLVVTGAGGQLGSDLALAGVADPRVSAVQGVTHSELDITDSTAVRSVIVDQSRGAERVVVINTAAWTDVDAAEGDEAGAFAINATGPALLAAACAEVGARLIHVSTDYVFDGSSDRPYDEDDPTGPVSAYGRTKEAGERAVRELHPDGGYVVRTAWVYGAAGSNFVKTILRLESEREILTVVDDQRGSPTWSHDLARGLLDLAASAVPAGIYHLTGSGETTWFEFARTIFAQVGADQDRVKPCTTGDFPRAAPRPAYSVLAHDKWVKVGLQPLPHWEKSIMKAFGHMGNPAVFGMTGRDA